MHAGKIQGFFPPSPLLLLSFTSILLLLLLRRDMHFCFWSRCCCCKSFFLLAALLLLLMFVLPTTSVLKQREVPATVSSFYVSVVHTEMLRTSIAAVVFGCFNFCPLDCDNRVMVVDCAAVEMGCMLEKYNMVAHLQCYIKGIYTYLVRIQKFLFHFPFDEIYRRLLFFTLGRSVSA